LRIIFTGDIWPGWLPGASRLQLLLPALFRHSWSKARIEFQARHISREISSVLSKADSICGNLEGVLSSRGKAIGKKKYVLQADTEYVNLLKQVGITHVTLANNHILDFGPEALADTCHALDKAKISYLGLNTENSPCRPAIIQNDSDRVALLNYVEPSIIDPDPDSFFKEACSPCPLEPEQIVKDIERLASEYAVVVVLHWGQEWSFLESAAQRQLAHRLIDAGAAAVIGHHTHLAGRVEEYRGGLIIYSLGNFIMTLPPFSARRASYRPLAELYFTNNHLVNYRLTPLFDDKNGFPIIANNWEVASLQDSYKPPQLPADAGKTFDSFTTLNTAKVTAIESSDRIDSHWSDDYFVDQSIIEGKFPLGPGWRLEGKEWSGTALSREFLGGKFMPINISHIHGDAVLSNIFRLDKSVSKLHLIVGYPEYFRSIPKFNCPRLVLRVDGQSVYEFTPRVMTDWEITEISSLGTEIEIQIVGQPEQYNLICWRVLG